MTRSSAGKSRSKRFVFRLYVAGSAPHSERARENLHHLCERHIGGNYELDVIDVLSDPRRAIEESIFVTPTLVKISPPPARIIVGDLSEEATALAALGLPSKEKRSE